LQGYQYNLDFLLKTNSENTKRPKEDTKPHSQRIRDKKNTLLFVYTILYDDGT